MREIQTAENKTLKLTNVVSRRIQPEEFNNMQIVLTSCTTSSRAAARSPSAPSSSASRSLLAPTPSPRST